METSIMTYITLGLIFLILFFIVLTLIIRKREEKLTDEFGKESNHVKEAFYKNEKKAQAKRNESIIKEKARNEQYTKENTINEIKNNKRKNMENTTIKTKEKVFSDVKNNKTSLLLKIVVITTFIHFICQMLAFIANMTENYEIYSLSKGFYHIDAYFFLVVAIYGIRNRKKEGLLLLILFFIGQGAEGITGIPIISVLNWFLTGAIFKDNFSIKFSAFLGILIVAIRTIIFLIQINTENLSFIGSFSINPSFIIMINLVGILQAFLLIMGVNIECKKSQSVVNLKTR